MSEREGNEASNCKATGIIAHGVAPANFLGAPQISFAKQLHWLGFNL